MFGFLQADRSRLTPEEQSRYRACYCGLCRSLGERYGQLARFTLNYDMTFLVLLLQSLYEPEERSGSDRCPPHPIQARPWQRSACSDYAADLNIALAYHKCRDDWQDEGRLTALAASGALKAAYEKVRASLPRQCDAIERALRELHELEQSRTEDPDAASACFGRLLGELFVWRQDRWSETLRAMGEALGRFLYVMDACVDLDADAVWGRYDPFRRYYGLPDNGQRFRRILEMLLGDCLRPFDRLPLVQDAGILKNILCVGIWSGFDRKYPREKETADGARSV